MSALFGLFENEPEWTQEDQRALAQAVRNKLKRSHLIEKHARFTAYQLWKALPWHKRIFTRRPG